VKSPSTTKLPRETLNLRIPAAERNLIDRAARSTGKTRTNFVLEAARHAAEEALLNQTLMLLGEEAYAEFLGRLNAPAQPNEQLLQTMRTKTPWAKG